MTAIRLGISPCPNDVFIFAGILRDAIDTPGYRFDVLYEDVETLNRRAQGGELDVVKISYANYVRCQGKYRLLDCGGALGRGCGPLLLRQGAARCDLDAEFLVPGEFTTANLLLDFHLRRPIRKTFLPFDILYDRLREAPGAQGVVIHEKRFTYARDGLTLVRDLGSYWEEKTGLPIPLGAIAVRRDLAGSLPVDTWIRESLRWAQTHRTEALALCREHAQDLDQAVIESHIALYVNDYSWDLGDDGRAAVAFFLAEQARMLENRPNETPPA